MFGLIATLVWIIGVLGIVSGVLILIFSENLKRYSIVSFTIFVFAIITITYSWHYEEEYYFKHGNPHVQYAQLKAFTNERITLYTGESTRSEGIRSMLKGKADLSGFKNEDIVRITYLKGYYHSFVVSIDRLILDEK
jgi:hypothetical protein